MQVVDDQQQRPCSAAAVRTCWTTISQARNAAPLSSPAPALGSSEPSRSSTVAHGHSAGAPSSCEQRPQAMVMPWSAAYVAASIASRLLPIPGSPVSATNAGELRGALRRPGRRGR